MTHGAKLLGRLEGWIADYMAMDRDYALVVALFAFNTWVFRVFDATPFLVISAVQPGCGKTRLLNLAAFLSRNGQVLTDATKASTFRLMDMYEGWFPLFIDEAEKYSGEGHEMRALINSGYTKGQSVPRSMPGGKGAYLFDVFGPRAFTLIGDVYETLRDRSITLRLTQGEPSRKFRRVEAAQEAAMFRSEIEAIVKAWSDIAVVDASWLTGRDEEIWTPLVSIAQKLGVSAETLDRVINVSGRLTGAKSEKARRYVDMGQSEEEKIAGKFGKIALVDLRRVMPVADKIHTGDLHAEEAVRLMKELKGGPWQTFRGNGLTKERLADLLAPFGIATAEVRMIRGRKGKVLKGYRAANVAADVKEGE